ncbi:MAG: sulfotransferase [Myxococcota bacterium]
MTHALSSSLLPPRRNPKRAQQALRRAHAALQRSDSLDAIRHLTKAIERDRECGPAYLALAKLLLARNEARRAEGLFARAVELMPREASGRLSLAMILRSRGRHDRALGVLRDAARLNPQMPEVWRELGEVELMMGNLEEARSSFRRLRSLRPKDRAAAVGLAAVAERAGKPKVAVSLLTPVVEMSLEDGSVTTAMLTTWGRAMLRSGGAEQALRVITMALPDASGSKESVFHLLGDCADVTGHYDEAFEAHRAANRARNVFYDPEAHRQYVDSLIDAFPRSRFQDDGPSGRKVVLVVGMPRSGTTLVETILGRHPDVTAFGELQALPDLAHRCANQSGSFPSGVGALAPELRDALRNEYLGALSSDSAVVTDKLPDNYLLVGFAALLMPNVRVVWCQRNAVDTCLSGYFQDFGPRLPYTRRLDWLGARYRDHERLMRHWCEVLPDVVHAVPYESLTEAPETEVRALLDHCGLSWADECLSPEASERVVATASYAQVQQPIHRRSVGRSASYEAHLAPLRSALAAR